MRALVLGGGVVGEAVAFDLARLEPVVAVTVADVDAARLSVIRDRLGVATQQADLRDMDAIGRLAAHADVTIGTLPSTLALPVIERMAELGRRHVDVSFLAADPRQFDAIARTTGATIVYDCGVAPGVSHVLVGEAVRHMARTASVCIDVGGLPVDPVPPFFYKAPFAPVDVIEEYTRPARVVRGGRVTIMPALSEPESLHIVEVGALEAFNTDGLRSLLDTVQADTMTERTLRYHGHLAIMKALADANMFETTPVSVDGRQVVPRDVVCAVLFPHWRYAPGERDLTVLTVSVEGVGTDDAPCAFEWTMVDVPPSGTPLSSMARTTGSPAAIVARWLHAGLDLDPGIHPPEHLGLTGHAPALLAALAHRGITIARRA